MATSGFRIQALMPHCVRQWLSLSSWPFHNRQSDGVGNSGLTGLCHHLTGHWRLFSLFSQVLTSRGQEHEQQEKKKEGACKYCHLVTASSCRRPGAVSPFPGAPVICHVLRPLGPWGCCLLPSNREQILF